MNDAKPYTPTEWEQFTMSAFPVGPAEWTRITATVEALAAAEARVKEVEEWLEGACEDAKRFAQPVLMERIAAAERDRDEARAEAAVKGAALWDRERAVTQAAEAVREASARIVENADDGVPLQCLADNSLRALDLAPIIAKALEGKS